MSLAAGFMLDQIDSRSAFPLYVGGSISLLGLILMIIAGGWVRGLGLVLVLIGIIVMLAVWLVRAAARTAIHKFAQPQAIVQKREQVNAALVDANLPTGPVSAIRYITRFRKGLRPEIARLRTIFTDLQTELDLDLVPGEPGRPEIPE